MIWALVGIFVWVLISVPVGIWVGCLIAGTKPPTRAEVREMAAQVACSCRKHARCLACMEQSKKDKEA